MSVELGWKENIDYCLVGLASVSAAAEELERAARLLGAAEALGEEIHLRLEPYAESTRARTARELELTARARPLRCLPRGGSLAVLRRGGVARFGGHALITVAWRPAQSPTRSRPSKIGQSGAPVHPARIRAFAPDLQETESDLRFLAAPL